MFEAAFGRGPGMETVGMALASYQRGLVSASSAFDRWYFGGEEHAMGAAALRGFKLFQAEGCVSCHSISENHALFSDGRFHNTGIGFANAMLSERDKAATLRLAPGVEVTPKVQFGKPETSDLGRYEATGRAADRWLYRTPSLRNVAVTAPYMHDGSLPDLASVLDFYNRGAVPHAELDSRLRAMGLNQDQLDDLRSFLLALTGDNLLQLQTDGRAAAIGDTLDSDTPDTH